MTTVKLTPTEFSLFKELANNAKEMFTFLVKEGVVIITASILFLTINGYI